MSKSNSLAIAYSVKRKPKKMALGGAVESATHSEKYSRNPGTPAKKPDDSRRPKDAYLSADWAGSPELDDASDTSMRPSEQEYMAAHFAKGGTIDSMVDKVMHRRMMAEGGEVDAPTLSDARAHAKSERNDEDYLHHSREHGMAYDRMAPEDRGEFSGNGPANTAQAKEEELRRRAPQASKGDRGGAKVKSSSDLKETYDATEEYAEGGEVADEIMRKRKRYAEGGEVDLDANSEESPNEEDQMSFKANGKELYDLEQLDSQPEDSNEHGDELSDEDENDDVSKIRGKMKMKARLK